ncbi:hypothetical protein LZ31DRAFT_528479 [Colletotrichum somersetense]|nr:hypothetical protein LZ31DRAFT_528479 [Colletotrichum somersetense]
MLRLDATIIRLSLSEVKGYGRNRQSKGQSGRADTDPLASTISPQTGWQSLYEPTDSPHTYPSDRPPLVMPHNLSTAGDRLEISTGGGSGGNRNDKNNNHNEADKPFSIDIHGAMTLSTGQHTDCTGSTSILRQPLPPSFAATPGVSSPLFQPSTRATSHRQLSRLRMAMTHITPLQ